MRVVPALLAQTIDPAAMEVTMTAYDYRQLIIELTELKACKERWDSVIAHATSHCVDSGNCDQCSGIAHLLLCGSCHGKALGISGDELP